MRGALGSVILLTDNTQTKAATYTYDSWGNTTATGTQAAANPWQYAGGYKDTTTGYTKFGARYYNPATGRFTQPDPSGQEQNRYLYAQANPCNNTDQTGLNCASDIIGLIFSSIVFVGSAAAAAAAAVPTAGVGTAGGIIAAVGAFGGIIGFGVSAAETCQ